VAQSLTRLLAHLVFSTKHRDPWLVESIRPEVHGYLASVVRDLSCPWVVVGGVADHVHILLDQGKRNAPEKIVEHVKRESSKFVKTLGPQYRGFYWQRGYGIFSVSPKDLVLAEAYVRNQVHHHQRISFQEEFRAMLERYRIQFDERFLWD
jgi:REP element-mobilizing transposase RayT